MIQQLLLKTVEFKLFGGKNHPLSTLEMQNSLIPLGYHFSLPKQQQLVKGLCVQAINIVDPGYNQKAMYPLLKTTQYIGKNKSLVYFDSMSHPGKKILFFFL